MMPVGDPAAAWLEGGQAVTEDSTFVSRNPNSTTAVRPNPSITAIDSLQIERLKVGIVSILLSFSRSDKGNHDHISDYHAPRAACVFWVLRDMENRQSGQLLGGSWMAQEQIWVLAGPMMPTRGVGYQSVRGIAFQHKGQMHT